MHAHMLVVLIANEYAIIIIHVRVQKNLLTNHSMGAFTHSSAVPPSVWIYPYFYGSTQAFTDEKC